MIIEKIKKKVYKKFGFKKNHLIKRNKKKMLIELLINKKAISFLLKYLKLTKIGNKNRW